MSVQAISLRPGQRVKFLPNFYNYVSGHMLFLPEGSQCVVRPTREDMYEHRLMNGLANPSVNLHFPKIACNVSVNDIHLHHANIFQKR